MVDSVLDPTMPPFAKDVCKELHDAGVSWDDINQGCEAIDPLELAPNFTTVGAGGDIMACECLQTAVRRFSETPDNPVYRSLVSDIIEGPLPMEITDRFYLLRIADAIAVLDQIIQYQGIATDSVAYKTMMAVGLFYFTIFPDKQSDIDVFMPELIVEARELYKYDLGDFEDYLFAYGGLGAFNPLHRDCEDEQTAEGALDLDCGWCSEYSKVLYAVFDQAGLDPFFATMTKEVSQQNFETLGYTVPEDQLNLGHLFIGIEFSPGDTMYFDPNNRFCDPPYTNTQHQHLSHFLAENIGQQHLNNKNQDPATIQARQRAATLDPYNPQLSYTLGKDLLELGRNEEAEEYLRAALAQDPFHVGALVDLSVALERQERLDEGFATIQEAYALSPDYPDILSRLGTFQLKTGDLEGAKTTLLQAYEQDPRNISTLNNLAITYRDLGQIEEGLYYLNGAHILEEFQIIHALAGQLNDPEKSRKFSQRLDELTVAFAGKKEAAFVIPELQSLNLNYPTSVGYNNLGAFLYTGGHKEVATNAFGNAVKLAVVADNQPALKIAYKNLVQALKDQIYDNLDHPVFERIINDDSIGANYIRGALLISFNQVSAEYAARGMVIQDVRATDIRAQLQTKSIVLIGL